MKKESIMQKVLKSYRTEVETMCFRHPWFNLVYNWIIWCLIIALAVACIGWAMDIRTERRAAALTATAMADWQAERNAEETARMEEMAAIQSSETAIIRSEAEYVAKLFYGIDRFVNKYNYTEKNLMTYARCVFNRVESSAFPNTVSEVISQENQWTGYYDNNPIIKYYYEVALKAVEEWHYESFKPCTIDFLWAEIMPEGIFLKNDFHANAYQPRWKHD